jgi:hypothetical protein
VIIQALPTFADLLKAPRAVRKVFAKSIVIITESEQFAAFFGISGIALPARLGLRMGQAAD